MSGIPVRTVLSILKAISKEPRQVQQGLHSYFNGLINDLDNGIIQESQIEVRDNGEIKIHSKELPQK